MKWSDIPTSARMTAVTIPVIAATVLWMFSTFESAVSAEQKWVQHNQAIACRTVYELQQQIRAYLGRLKFDVTLTTDDRAWIGAEIEALEKNIQRLDPGGRC